MRRPGLNSRTSAAWLGALAVLGCALMVGASAPFAGHHPREMTAILAIWLPVVPVVLSVTLLVPWDDLHRELLLFYPLTLIAVLGLTGREAPLISASYSPMFVVLFAYAGLTQRRLVSPLLVTPAVFGWHDTLHDPTQQTAVHVVVVCFVWVLVAELLAWRMAEQAQVRFQLAATANRDELTGLDNRHALATAMQLPIPHAALVMIDLDHFKALNDTFGHLEGDRVLVDFAHVLGAVLRSSDRSFRYGGEEFLVIAPRSGVAGAERLLERVQTAWATLRPDVTFSAGIAAWGEGEAGRDAIRRADAALYRAKADGRNRWRIAASGTPPQVPGQDAVQDRAAPVTGTQAPAPVA